MQGITAAKGYGPRTEHHWKREEGGGVGRRGEEGGGGGEEEGGRRREEGALTPGLGGETRGAEVHTFS